MTDASSMGQLLGLIVQNPTTMSVLQLAVYATGGAVGAFTREIMVSRGVLELPYKRSGKLHLGFVGVVLIGMVAAILADGNFLTALLSGVAGTSIVEGAARMVNGRKPPAPPPRG